MGSGMPVLLEVMSREGELLMGVLMFERAANLSLLLLLEYMIVFIEK